MITRFGLLIFAILLGTQVVEPRTQYPPEFYNLQKKKPGCDNHGGMTPGELKAYKSYRNQPYRQEATSQPYQGPRTVKPALRAVKPAEAPEDLRAAAENHVLVNDGNPIHDPAIADKWLREHPGQYPGGGIDGGGIGGGRRAFSLTKLEQERIAELDAKKHALSLKLKREGIEAFIKAHPGLNAGEQARLRATVDPAPPSAAR